TKLRERVNRGFALAGADDGAGATRVPGGIARRPAGAVAVELRRVLDRQRKSGAGEFLLDRGNARKRPAVRQRLNGVVRTFVGGPARLVKAVNGVIQVHA